MYNMTMHPIRRLMTLFGNMGLSHFGCNEMQESLLREFTSSIIDFHEITPRTSIYDSNVSNETFDELDLEIWVVRSGRSIKSK